MTFSLIDQWQTLNQQTIVNLKISDLIWVRTTDPKYCQDTHRWFDDTTSFESSLDLLRARLVSCTIIIITRITASSSIPSNGHRAANLPRCKKTKWLFLLSQITDDINTKLVCKTCHKDAKAYDIEPLTVSTSKYNWLANAVQSINRGQCDTVLTPYLFVCLIGI